jgi:hypothetical protein
MTWTVYCQHIILQEDLELGRKNHRVLTAILGRHTEISAETIHQTGASGIIVKLCS